MRRDLTAERQMAVACGLGLLGLVALAALTHGCGTVDEAWTSPLGVRMATGPLDTYFTPEQLDMHAYAAVGDMLGAGYPGAELWRAVPLQLVAVFPERLPLPGGPNGAVVGNGLWVRAFPCVWGTALRHEMVHQLEAHVGSGEYDYNHRGPQWRHANEPLGVCP